MTSNPLFLIFFGLVVGVFSGIMGLGGGSIMIPIMVLFLGMSQPQAHGTSLAVMIPPVTIPAVVAYYMTRDPATGARNVDLVVAAWMALGVAAGTYFGARVANSLPKETLKLVFGFMLIYVAAYTVLGKEHLVRTLLLSLALLALAMGAYAGTRWYDARAARDASATGAGDGGPVVAVIDGDNRRRATDTSA